MFVVGLVMIGCDRSPTGYALEQFRGVSMGTTYTVKLVELPRDLQVTAVHNDIDLVLQEVNQRMSTYLDDSELSLFNHSAETSWIDASEELVDLLSQA